MGDWYGPIDFLELDSCTEGSSHGEADSAESVLMGAPIGDVPDACTIANPITWIDSSDPPFWVFHGTADQHIPICQSELLVDALRAAEVPVEFVVGKGVDHGMDEAYYDLMADFFHGALAPAEASSSP